MENKQNGKHPRAPEETEGVLIVSKVTYDSNSHPYWRDIRSGQARSVQDTVAYITFNLMADDQSCRTYDED